MRDIDVEGYPLPCDPASGMGWWRFNLWLCFTLPGWSIWQHPKRMAELIPVIRWLVYAPIRRESV